MTIRRLCILGATGSIGASTLAVVDANPDAFEVVALSGHRNLEQMVLLCQRYRPQAVVMADAQLAQQLTQRLQDPAISIGYGDAALCELAADSASDTVVAAVVGAAGLAPTLAAVTAGKRVLLANKEALVMSGALFIDAVRQHNAQLLPIDSEHNAIFQCLPSQVQQQLGYCDIHAYGIRQLILTGSGGPFRQTPIADLAYVTPAQACKHPNWSMGQKISVDSATMMNKGLEFIEAKWLFNCRPQDIEVVVHPQSVVHSMVQYQDGSVLAQLGQPDMQTPIAHALSFPERCRTEVASLDWRKMNALTFEAPDFQRFACLKLAIDACHAGQEACTILNAANEIAVAGFLAGAMRFTDIAVIVEQTLSQVTWQQATNLESLIELDRMSRTVAKHLLSQRNAC